MSTFKLALPTDIPWRRLCVSADMLDPLTCDDERPPRWRSSMAVFRYDPAEEYQADETRVVTYLKVVCTIAPFQPEIGLSHPLYNYTKEPELIDSVEESFPCYGAILQVSVGPATGQGDVPLQTYPYIVDVEPKKRELYESVTDTSEVLSGSRSSLSVGKSATNTYSLEDYNLDMGGGGGGGLFWGLIEANGNVQQQTGTVAKSNSEVSNVRTTDFADERRQAQSHTTQLTQMYNLFQVFHLGTNRVLFLMEPRPHVRQTEATFINGPRALEGVQEVFLVVSRPKTMTDLCVGALLETAHLAYAEEKEQQTKTVKLVFHAKGHSEYNDEEGVLDQEDGYDEVTYTPEPGWQIDLAAGSGGYTITTEKRVPANTPNPKPTVTKTKFHIAGTVKPTAELRLAITIYLWSLAGEVHYVRKLYLSARELCCCPPTASAASSKPWITYEKSLSARVDRGLTSAGAFSQSRILASAVRDEMVRSFTASRRYPHRTVEYADSDTFHTRTADVLEASPTLGGHTRLPIADLAVLSDPEAERLSRAMGQVSVADFLRLDGAVLAATLSTDLARITEAKNAAVRVVVERSEEPRT